MNEVHLMALMIMAVKVCPKEVESTVFEVIMGVINVSYLISYESGGLISKLLHIGNGNYENLWIQVLIATVFPIVMLISFLFVPTDFD